MLTDIAPELLPTWQRIQTQYLDRATVLAEAAQILSDTGALSETIRQKAIREAHTLNGSLGSFELHQAAQIARNIEQLLQLEQQDSLQIKQLSQYVMTLRQSIEQTPISTNP